MRGPTGRGLGTVVDGRAHERVSKLDARCVHLDDAGLLRQPQRRDTEPEVAKSRRDRSRVVTACSHDQQRASRVHRQAAQAPAEELLHSFEPHRLVERGAAGQLRLVELTSKLQQRERVASGRGGQPISHARRDRSRRVCVQQRRARVVVEPLQRQS